MALVPRQGCCVEMQTRGPAPWLKCTLIGKKSVEVWALQLKGLPWKRVSSGGWKVHTRAMHHILFSSHSSNPVVERGFNSMEWDFSSRRGKQTPLFFPSKVGTPGLETFELCPQPSKSNFPGFFTEQNRTRSQGRHRGSLKGCFPFMFLPLKRQMTFY